jgi:serine protease inhibitor
MSDFLAECRFSANDEFMKRRGLVILKALVIICLADPTLPTAAAVPNENSQPDLVVSNLSLAFRLTRQLVNEQTEENLFLSPFSVCEVLQILYNGADRETEQQIKRLLGLDRKTFGHLIEQVEQSIRSKQQGAVLDLANSIWFDKAIKLNTNFISGLSKSIPVAVEAIDFGDPRSMEMVNNWTADRTHGRILKIVSERLWTKSDLVVINAIFFQGDWESRFEKSNTKEQPFNLEKGGKKQIPMMHNRGDFLYHEGSGFQVVELPYERSSLAMLVLLPNADSNLQKLLQTLDGRFYHDEVISKLRKTHGALALPRFKFDCETDLKNTLVALSMRDAFDVQRANFSRMSAEHMWIHTMRQKSTLLVDEHGTIAAAATVAAAARGGIDRRIPPPFEMIVDRPFLFIICDRSTETILFIGLVRNPNTQAEA